MTELENNVNIINHPAGKKPQVSLPHYYNDGHTAFVKDKYDNDLEILCYYTNESKRKARLTYPNNSFIIENKHTADIIYNRRITFKSFSLEIVKSNVIGLIYNLHSDKSIQEIKPIKKNLELYYLIVKLNNKECYSLEYSTTKSLLHRKLFLLHSLFTSGDYDNVNSGIEQEKLKEHNIKWENEEDFEDVNNKRALVNFLVSA